MPNNPSDLKASGLKATLPRLKILEIFQSSSVRHLSAEDVYKILLTENMVPSARASLARVRKIFLGAIRESAG